MATTFVTKRPWIWYDIDHIDIFLETSNVRWMKLQKLAFNALWHTVASNDGTNVTNNKSINVLFIFIEVLSLFIHKILCMNGSIVAQFLFFTLIHRIEFVLSTNEILRFDLKIVFFSQFNHLPCVSAYNVLIHLRFNVIMKKCIKKIYTKNVNWFEYDLCFVIHICEE